MKFTSFLWQLVFHALLWGALTLAFNFHEVGIENLAVFVVSVLALGLIVKTVVGGGLRSLDVPGGALGKGAFWLFHTSRMLIVAALAAHAHFIAAFLALCAALLIFVAFTKTRAAEAAIRQALAGASDSMNAFDAQTKAAGAALEPKAADSALSAHVDTPAAKDDSASSSQISTAGLAPA